MKKITITSITLILSIFFANLILFPTPKMVISSLSFEDKESIFNYLKGYSLHHDDKVRYFESEDFHESELISKYSVLRISASSEEVLAICVSNVIGARYSLKYMSGVQGEKLVAVFGGQEQDLLLKGRTGEHVSPQNTDFSPE